MRKLIFNKSFIVGFIGGFLVFIVLTLIIAKEMNPQPCHHCILRVGFPLVFHEQSFMSEGKFSILNFSIDLSFGFVFSILVGLGISFLINRKLTEVKKLRIN